MMIIFVSTHPFSCPSSISFHTRMGACSELTVQRVKPPLFHAKILAGVFIYLALLFGALRCLFPPGRE